MGTIKKLKRSIVRTSVGRSCFRKKNMKDHEGQVNGFIRNIILLDSSLKRKDVGLLMVSAPNAMEIRHLSRKQWYRIDNWTFDFNHINKSDAEILKTVYTEDIDQNYIMQLYDGIRVYDDYGVRRLADFKSRYVNIIGGNRITIGQPGDYLKSIYMFGSCTVRGTGVEDIQTIPSILQELLQNRKIRVVNKAVGCGFFLEDDFKHIRETALEPGDMVIIIEPFEYWQENAVKRAGVRHISLSDAFHKKHRVEWFTDSPLHTNAAGNQIIADYLYEKLAGLSIFKTGQNAKKAMVKNTDNSMTSEIPAELNAYLESLKEYHAEGSNGAIVMNCNPFTSGHRYLTEFGAKHVDTLYIFVVQENRSYFDFEDRFELVKRGVSDLDNVQVIPSGKYIISALTFPGYFIKENEPEITVDTSEDVRIFGQYIAPVLNIRKRFAGEEPIDPVTKQYNEEMSKILPEYGIEFVEVPRLKNDTGIISASKVRELLKNNDFEKLGMYVPETTCQYLKDKFGKE